MAKFVTIELLDVDGDIVEEFQFPISDLNKVWFIADLWKKQNSSNNFNLYFD